MSAIFRYVLALATIAAASGAIAADRSCASLFANSALGRKAPPSRPTVKVVGMTRNSSGEEFYRVRRLLEENSWNSNYSETQNNRQGDPTAPFRIMGFELARALGFGYGRRGEILVPTVATLNGRIGKFNSYLVSLGIKKIPVRFYVQSNLANVTFLRQWYHEIAIPIANDLSHRSIHDFSFHLSGVLLPIQIVRLIRFEASFALFALHQSSDPVFHQSGEYAVRLIDSLSTSASQTEDAFIDPSRIALHLRSVLAYRPGFSPEQLWDAYAGGPLVNVLRDRLLYENARLLQSRQSDEQNSAPVTVVAEPLTREQEALLQSFLDTNSEMKTTFTEMGLIDFEAISQIYNVRARELRKAAQSYVSANPEL